MSVNDRIRTMARLLDAADANATMNNYRVRPSADEKGDAFIAADASHPTMPAPCYVVVVPGRVA